MSRVAVLACLALVLGACAPEAGEDEPGGEFDGPADDWGPPECPPCHPSETCVCADDCTCQCPNGGEGETCPDGTELCALTPYDCCAHGGLCQFECDLWAQDCPAGDKCAPWGPEEPSADPTACHRS